MNLQTVASVLYKPKEFFPLLKKQTFKQTFLFYLILVLLGGILSTLSLLKTYGFSLMFFPLAYLLFMIVMLAMFFALAGIQHLSFLIFGGKGKFVDTFHLMVYGSVPSLLAGFPLNALSLIFQGNVLATIIISVVMYIFVIYSLCLEIIGGKILHNLSTGRSIFAILLPLAVLTFIVFVILMMVFLGSFFLGAATMGGI